MSVHFLQLIVVLFFSAFVFLDITSIATRVSGALIGKNALGYTLLVMVNTIKRILIVSYPPLIGIIAFIGTPHDVISVVYYCYAASAVPLVLAYIARNFILTAFAMFIVHYSRSGKMLYSVRASILYRRAPWMLMNEKVVEKFSFKNDELFRRNIDKQLLLLALWVSVFYTSSLFLINIMGAIFSSYGAVLYQLVGLVNAFGTLVLAFFLDPKLSRLLDNNGDLRTIYFTLILASCLSFVFVGPLFITAILLFVTNI